MEATDNLRTVGEKGAVKFFKKIGVSLERQTLTKWRQRGKGPAYHKFEGKVTYSLDDLRAFVERSRVVPQDKKKTRRRRAAK
jgi:hypothetical protein